MITVEFDNFLRAKKIYTEIEEINESLNELHAMSNAGKVNLGLGARNVSFEGEKANKILNKAIRILRNERDELSNEFNKL